ncbi:MAG: site-2 protease family protein [Luteolibacter sp.]
MPESDAITGWVGYSSPSSCLSCDTELAAALLSCPACGTLVHAARLKELAAAAGLAEAPADALGYWREAYELLPPGTRQQQAIVEKMDALVALTDRSEPRKVGSKTGKIVSGAGVIAVFFAKFKFLLLFVITKLKFLALGLTKMGTLLSMFLSFGLYWSIWGWKFAAGFILSIYIHEMGHVAMLKKLGVKASAPMFIPGVGAVVRLKQHLPTAREDARVGLAGPIWGLGAAIASWLLGVGFHLPLAIAVAKVGAWVNLFNLTPIWQLDGSRAFRALNRNQRIGAVVAVAAAIFLSAGDVHGILIIVMGFGVFRLFEKTKENTGDFRALVEYIVLIAALSALASLPVGNP